MQGVDAVVLAKPLDEVSWFEMQFLGDFVDGKGGVLEHAFRLVHQQLSEIQLGALA